MHSTNIRPGHLGLQALLQHKQMHPGAAQMICLVLCEALLQAPEAGESSPGEEEGGDKSFAFQQKV